MGALASVEILFKNLNGVNALFTVLTVIAAAIVVIAQTRKIGREQLTATAKEWQDIATARNERVTLLQQQIGGLQEQVTLLTAKMMSVERDREFLMGRNLDLERKLRDSERRVEQLETTMRAGRLSMPQRNNEEEGK